MSVEQALSEALVKLRSGASAGRHAEAAQMRLINLADVILAAGPDWPQAKERIRTGSMSFLRGCLGDDDIVIPCGDGFLVIFASADAAEVTRRTEEIRQTLIQFYLGQEGLDRLHVQAVRQSLPSSVLHALAADELLVEGASTKPRSHKFLFAPIWQTEKQAIISHWCTPVLNGPLGPLYCYDPVFYAIGRSDADDFLAVDLEALERVHAYLALPEPGVPQPALGVPVHASTMLRRSRRMAYLRRLGQILPEHARRLSVRISEIPRGTPISTLADWVGQLHASVRIVLLQFHYSEPPPVQLSLSGATGAGFATPQRSHATDAEMETFMRQLRIWAATLANCRMAFFLDNVRRAALVERARELGVHFLTSDKWPPTERPGAARYAPLGQVRS
jgi:hypothetical protein